MELEVFTTERLEYGFHCNTWANFSEHFCKQIPDLVGPDDREGPLWATKCIINCRRGFRRHSVMGDV